MNKPKLLVFASGDSKGGGSGSRELVENSRTGVLWADVVGMVSNHENGGVRKHADALGIEFYHMPKPYSSDTYQEIVRQTNAEWISLSGWLKLVSGLPVEKTFNIHPGPLPDFGGPGLYGHFVHEAVIAAFKRGEITHSAVTMHFVNERYDEGDIFFEYPVLIRIDDTPDSLAARVNKIEHGWQSFITHLVVTSQIRLERKELIVPEWYEFLPELF